MKYQKTTNWGIKISEVPIASLGRFHGEHLLNIVSVRRALHFIGRQFTNFTKKPDYYGT